VWDEVNLYPDTDEVQRHLLPTENDDAEVIKSVEKDKDTKDTDANKQSDAYHFSDYSEIDSIRVKNYSELDQRQQVL